MSVWLTIPSVRPNGGTASLWKERGYKVALWRDREEQMSDKLCDFWIVGEYQGYAMTVNTLVRAVLNHDPEATWCVAGGDDTEPDLAHSPEEIAQQCSEHFNRTPRYLPEHLWRQEPSATFGVMQPTGDRFAGGSIDRICGSPWLGRSFCERMYGATGPYWTGYTHMFPDEEIQEVAIKLGVLWQRRDLIHLHHHFQRTSIDLNSGAERKPIPAHLIEANSPEHWAKYSAIFKARKAAGFPGHEPL